MKLQQRVAYLTATVIILVGGAWWVFSPVGHLRQFDADLQPLAESPLEGWCSGHTFIDGGGGRNAQQAKAAICRTDNAETYSASVDMTAVVPSFCLGAIAAGWQGNLASCESILAQNNLWPTLHGQLTNAWNKAHPYPGGEFSARVSDSSDNTGRGQTR